MMMNLTGYTYRTKSQVSIETRLSERIETRTDTLFIQFFDMLGLGMSITKTGTLGEGLPVPVVTIGDATSVDETSMTLNATYTSEDAVTSASFLYSTNPDMSSASTISATDSPSGTLTANLTGLSEGVNYYILASVTTINSVVNASDVLSQRTVGFAGWDGPENENYTLVDDIVFNSTNGTAGFTDVPGGQQFAVVSRVASQEDGNGVTVKDVLKLTCQDPSSAFGGQGVALMRVDSDTSAHFTGLSVSYYYAITFKCYIPESNSETNTFANFNSTFEDEASTKVLGYGPSDVGNWKNVAYEDLNIVLQSEDELDFFFTDFDNTDPGDEVYIADLKIYRRSAL